MQGQLAVAGEELAVAAAMHAHAAAQHGVAGHLDATSLAAVSMAAAAQLAQQAPQMLDGETRVAASKVSIAINMGLRIMCFRVLMVRRIRLLKN